jgi:hypothetical protein
MVQSATKELVGDGQVARWIQVVLVEDLQHNFEARLRRAT